MVDHEDWRNLESFAFGDSPQLADELLALVLAGKKTATCWSATDGPDESDTDGPDEVGERAVVLDGEGRPRAVIETVEITQRRFNEVDAAFAYDEGEGDRSLSYWRAAHQAFFAALAYSRLTCRFVASDSGWLR